jgi:hypothetical protein
MFAKLLVVLLLVGQMAFGQQANNLLVVQQKMQNLEWLKGKWLGTAYLNGEEGSKKEFKHTLEFSNKLNNTVFLINETAIMGQDTLAQNIGLLGYNHLKSIYNLQAYTNEGVNFDAYVEVLEKKVIWRIHYSGSIIKYTARLNDKGQWHQIGEMSHDDGKKWNHFFESTLSRVN